MNLEAEEVGSQRILKGTLAPMLKGAMLRRWALLTEVNAHSQSAIAT